MKKDKECYIVCYNRGWENSYPECVFDLEEAAKQWIKDSDDSNKYHIVKTDYFQ